MMTRNRSNSVASSQAPASDMRIDEFAHAIANYSQEYRDAYPDASPRSCVEMAAGRFANEYGPNPGRLVEMAIAEMAAKWVFHAPPIAAE